VDRSVRDGEAIPPRVGMGNVPATTYRGEIDMSQPLSRRDLIRTLGTAGAAMVLPAAGVIEGASSAQARSAIATNPGQAAEILPLSSTSEVFIPPRGRAYQKFSFDFPEPSVAFGELRFAFLVFTRENTYGMDRTRMTATVNGDEMIVHCNGFVRAGGQQTSPGTLEARFHRQRDSIEWNITVEMDQPVKSVSTVIRGVPRGELSFSAGGFADRADSEVLVGYPFSGGDLFGGNSAGGLTTPLAVVRRTDRSYFALSSLDDRVRAKRFYFQPGENGYRVEAVFEAEGWMSQPRLEVPPWRILRATSVETAMQPHFDHLERAYRLQPWETRADVPAWMRDIALVTTLHGMHYTGYIFNDYARMLEILQWMATQIPAGRVLAFLSSWDGRYYWDYPNYQVSDRMGGDAAFRRLVGEAQRLGFRMMPMYGSNTANRKQPAFRRVADAATAKIDGDAMDLNWVDWDNDRHQEGWLAYMNLGVDSWRDWLERRIDDMITRYGVDAYFLDIIGGWTNNTTGDMHEGARRMVSNLRQRHPDCVCVGEMHYDALLEFIPMYHAGGGGVLKPGVQRWSRFFQHLSHPAPGRGSTGVHEAGFGRFNTETLSLVDTAIPTLNVVDDTFADHRDLMAAVIRKAKERAGIA
jgi:hypothetical protein